MTLGSKSGQKPVVVRKIEKLGERERKALFPSEGKGHDDECAYDSRWYCINIGFKIPSPPPHFT